MLEDYYISILDVHVVNGNHSAAFCAGSPQPGRHPLSPLRHVMACWYVMMVIGLGKHVVR